MNLDQLFILSQYLTPQHGLSRLVGQFAKAETPLIKDRFINWFIDQYGVNMSEAVRKSANEYHCFNDFFTRELETGARPIDPSPNSIVSPVDGAISQIGKIENGRIFQAKGHSFGLVELLGGTWSTARPFGDGEFTTIYLSPKDYHRIHMPITGTLKEMIYVPGKLFSVNPITAQNVPNLFARNERVVALFDTPIGPMAMVLVGAMIVASMATVWAGTINPGRHIYRREYTGGQAITLEKGQEMGRFLLGSTVVLTFPKGTMNWNTEYQPESAVRLGQPIGQTMQKSP